MTISIWSRYRGNASEKIDTATTRASAAYLAREYALAFGRDWIIWVGRKDQEPR